MWFKKKSTVIKEDLEKSNLILPLTIYCRLIDGQELFATFKGYVDYDDFGDHEYYVVSSKTCMLWALEKDFILADNGISYKTNNIVSYKIIEEVGPVNDATGVS